MVAAKESKDGCMAPADHGMTTQQMHYYTAADCMCIVICNHANGKSLCATDDQISENLPYTARHLK